MNTTQALKQNLISYLSAANPDPDTISVVDAKKRGEIDLPTIAVEVASAEPHSVVLAHIQRSEVQIALRCHAGDESEASVDSWIDQIESSLNDASQVKYACSDGLQVDNWLYQGSEQEWDESTLEVTFSAECLCTRR